MFPDGYQTMPGLDAAEDHIGPFYYRQGSAGMEYAFRASEQHCNANGTVHGGVLMTFADYSLSMTSTDGYDNESCVTVSFSCEFMAAVEIGQVVECTVDVNRKTGSMVFVSGKIHSNEILCFTFSAVVKRIRS